MVELSELAENSGRLLSVVGHSSGEGFCTGRTDGLLMVGDVPNQQGTELRDQLQTQRLPQSVEERG